MELPKITVKQYTSVFHINEEQQQRVYQHIKDSAKADVDFFVLLFFSSIIIALGLVIDSSAVVIGGMLIAPMVWPILAVALSIIKGRSQLLGQSIVAVFKSSLLILLVGIVLGLIVPESLLQNQEIVSRTQPQLFELGIALASGFIGAYVVAHPRLGNAMAGVVVAAALVPPLATMGLLVAQNDLAGASGAFLLFVSNLIAITLAAAGLFSLVQFRGPQTEHAQAVQKSNLRWTVLFLIVIAVPLVLITSDTIRSQRQRSVVREVVVAKIDGVQIQDVGIGAAGDVLTVAVTVRSPRQIYPYQVEELTTILSQELEQSVVLKISVIPVLEAGRLVPDSDSILNDLQSLQSP